MVKTINALALTGLLSLFAAPGAHADKLLIDAVREASLTGTPAPRQGETMDQVRSSLGTPEQQINAVGQPPISRWVYDGYTIYFENDRVLHTVPQR